MDGSSTRRSLAGDRHDLYVDAAAMQAAAEAPHPDHDDTLGYVHSFESAGTLDGPGIRFVVFLTGCQLRCLYCHNPDTWHIKNGHRVTVDEVMAEIEPYVSFLTTYHGGVTFSGGEALVQTEFLAHLLKRCKSLGLHTAVDTNGYLGDRASPSLMDDVDLWLLDLKSFDPATHKRVTGVDVEPILSFARRLSDEGRKLWVRFVLVPGLTDGPDNVGGLADFVSTLSGVERVEVLPFHQMGAFKWRSLGLDYRLADLSPPTEAETATVRQAFASRGLHVV